MSLFDDLILLKSMSRDCHKQYLCVFTVETIEKGNHIAT